MKLSVVATLEGEFYFPDLLPGQTFQEKLAHLKRFGFDSVEIWGWGLERHVDEVSSALKHEGVAVSVICSGFRGSLLDADRAKRLQANEDFQTLLKLAGRLNAGGMVFVPVFASGPQVADLSPYKDSATLERELLLDSLTRLAKVADAAGTRLLIEPVNHYETHLVNRVEQGVAICKEVGSEALRVIADFYHMNIEEVDMAETIRQFGAYIKHYHIGDSNRCLPGQGHLDYGLLFDVLRQQRYEGHLSLECFAKGDVQTVMPQCAALLRQHRGDRS